MSDDFNKACLMLDEWTTQDEYEDDLDYEDTESVHEESLETEDYE